MQPTLASYGQWRYRWLIQFTGRYHKPAQIAQYKCLAKNVTAVSRDRIRTAEHYIGHCIATP